MGAPPWPAIRARAHGPCRQDVRPRARPTRDRTPIDRRRRILPHTRWPRTRYRPAHHRRPILIEHSEIRPRITAMETRINEVANRIYRLSTFVPGIGPTGFTFNQYLIDDDEPLLFHTGPRAMFPLVAAAISTITPLERVRWITFGH